MRNNYIYILALPLMFLGFSACSDLLDTDLPSNETSIEDGLQTEADAQLLLNGIYDIYANGVNGNKQRFEELLADDILITGTTGFLVQVYNRASDFFNSDIGGYYQEPYGAIRRANLLLNNIDGISMSDAARNRMMGEALFLRAVSHFDLVRLFAHPYGFTSDNSHPGIVINTEHTEPFTATRSTVAQVYDVLIADLTQARDLLPTENGNYATKYAAHAYMAKVYFQMNDFANALTNAEAVIQSGQFIFSNELNNRFGSILSTEVVFATISTGLEDNRARLFKDMYNSAGGLIPVLKTNPAFNTAISNSPGDLRAAWLIPISFGGIEGHGFTKFNQDWMHVVNASLTEMLLIAAESMAELNQNLSTAIDYVNMIKNRADVATIDAGASAGFIIQEARNERHLEFVAEGHRLHELKRRGAKGENIVIRGAPWNCNGMVLQFPASEITIQGFELNPEGGCL